MADETTLREYGRELGKHDAQIDTLSDKVDALDGKIDKVLEVVQGIKETNAEAKGKERLMNSGIALAVGAGISLFLKKFGV